jgi:hypothetical protein
LAGGARRPFEVEAEEIPTSAGSRRRYPIVLVRVCVYCSGSHLHRGPAAGPRKAGCSARRYWLVAA